MASLNDIVSYMDGILEPSKFSHDPSNNGLQFRGVAEVAKIAFAVDASAAVFAAAADIDADLVVTHHGLSWGSGFKRIDGILADRITLLAANGISLYSSHLPLDANELIGHNALIGGMLPLEDIKPFGTYHDYKIGITGKLAKPMTLQKIADILDKELPSSGDFALLGDPKSKITHASVISGGGAWPELFDEFEKTEATLLITGTATHEVFHPALESGINILMLGHYRSETPGIIALMNTVREHFGIECEFIDIPSGL